jgi:hypothetical protein
MNKNEGLDEVTTIPVMKDLPITTPPYTTEAPASKVAPVAAVATPITAITPPVSAEPNSKPNMFAGIGDDMTLDVNMKDPALAKYAKQAPDARPKLTASDLLPGYSKDSWFDNPDVGIKVEDANLMADALSKIGVDTVGTTQKNPSYDLRGTIPCPKFVVGPWNNSTVEPDINLKTFY